jgi:hypothetical protein
MTRPTLAFATLIAVPYTMSRAYSEQTASSIVTGLTNFR